RAPATLSPFPYTTLFRSEPALFSDTSQLSSEAAKTHRGTGGSSHGSQSSLQQTFWHVSPNCLSTGNCQSMVSVVGSDHCITPSRSEEHTSELQSRENLVC